MDIPLGGNHCRTASHQRGVSGGIEHIVGSLQNQVAQALLLHFGLNFMAEPLLISFGEHGVQTFFQLVDHNKSPFLTLFVV